MRGHGFGGRDLVVRLEQRPDVHLARRRAHVVRRYGIAASRSGGLGDGFGGDRGGNLFGLFGKLLARGRRRGIASGHRFLHDRDLDVAHLGPPSGCSRGTRAQCGEICLQCAGHAVAVLGLEAVQRLDVGEQRVPTPRQLDDLLLEPLAFGLTASPRLGLGIGNRPTRLDLGVVDHLARLGSCLRDSLIGRALRKQQRAMEDVLGLARTAGFRLRGAQTLGQLTNALVGSLERRSGALEHVVDVIAVVTAQRLLDLDVSEFAGGDLHVLHRNPGSLGSGGNGA